MNWNLTDAKNRLSEVLTRAASEGPQTIRRKSEDFVVLPKAQYEQLVGERPSFTDWLLKGPRIDDLELPPRGGSSMREVEL
ncbi:MAG TPA: type II toxin-antitoxin system prevent-host-death family antitoxin [Tepidisphaeraceae bacterium]|jgi:prevent-host-death family protein|nr:type II toxin-antitoxin system prevent-host-death family antitoxin [Tepidisphaeraceae bacterium]